MRGHDEFRAGILRFYILKPYAAGLADRPFYKLERLIGKDSNALRILLKKKACGGWPAARADATKRRIGDPSETCRGRELMSARG